MYAFALRQVGITARHRSALSEAVETWEQDPADLLVLIRPSEGELPHVIDRLRGQTEAPIVLVMDPPSSALHLSVIRAGADVILSLPIEPRLVAAYGLNLLRRRLGVLAAPLPALEVAGLRLDANTRSVSIGSGRPISLTPLEYRLLRVLLTQPGQVIPTDELIERVWGYSDSGSRDLARGLVHRLRLKLGDPASGPQFIETIPSVGYRLVVTG